MDLYTPRDFSPEGNSLSSLEDIEKQIESVDTKVCRSNHRYCNQHILRLACIINFLGMAFFVVSYGMKGQSTKSLSQSLEIGNVFSPDIDGISSAEPKKVVDLSRPQYDIANTPRIAWRKYYLVSQYFE